MLNNYDTNTGNYIPRKSANVWRGTQYDTMKLNVRLVHGEKVECKHNYIPPYF